MAEPLFLDVEDILYIHRREIEFAGNKRTAAAAALTFLYLNGYIVNERHPEELADLVLALLRREVDREDVGQWFTDRCVPLAPSDL